MAKDGWQQIDNLDLNDQLNDLIEQSTTFNEDIDPTVELEQPVFIDLEEIDNTSVDQATNITNKLSEYFFDEKYINNHPYIKNKIVQEMQNIRRLIKILQINEKAQDILISNICKTPNKSTLFGALTGLETTMLSVQKQLESHIKSLEDIFATMNADCEKTFQDKDKEINDDGSMISRGSRDFIKSLQEQLNKNMQSNV